MGCRRVLIATHSEDRTRVLGYRLRQIGDFEIVSRSNGAEVIAAVDESPPDLILMDLRLPVISGWEVVRRIRAAEGDGRHLPIVALTCCAMAGEERLALRKGWDDHLPNPIVDPASLREKLERLIGPLDRRKPTRPR